MDCSPPDSSVHGISQPKILEWIAISFSKGSSRPRDQPASLASPLLADGFFTTWEALSPSKPPYLLCIYLFRILLLTSAQLYLTLCDPMDCSPPRLLSPWNSPGKNTGVGCHFLLQGIFPTQGSNLCLFVSCVGRWVLYHQRHLE